MDACSGGLLPGTVLHRTVGCVVNVIVVQENEMLTAKMSIRRNVIYKVLPANESDCTDCTDQTDYDQ